MSRSWQELDAAHSGENLNMIGARATKRRMVHGKSSEAEVCPAQERKTFLIT